MDCSPPGSSVPGILQARMLEWVAMPPPPGDLPNPRILEWVAYPFSRESSWPKDKTQSPTLQVDSLPAELTGKPKKKKYSLKKERERERDTQGQSSSLSPGAVLEGTQHSAKLSIREKAPHSFFISMISFLFPSFSTFTFPPSQLPSASQCEMPIFEE